MAYLAAASLFLVNSPLVLGFSGGINTLTKFSSLVFLVRGLEYPSPLSLWALFLSLVRVLMREKPETTVWEEQKHVSGRETPGY